MGNDKIVTLYKKDESISEIKTKEQQIEFSCASHDIKGGGDRRNIPLVKQTKLSKKLRCNCKPIIVSQVYDCQSVDKLLFFARCEKHHITTTWGYKTEEEALKAWEKGEVKEIYE